MIDRDYLMRPPEAGEMPGQPWAPAPGSVRANVIAYYLAADKAVREIRSTRTGRLLWMLYRLRHPRWR